MPVRIGRAEWRGNLREGQGSIATETGALKGVAYNFVSRFEQGNETNPEELLGAAHAACFSMALANSLSTAGFKVNSVKTEDKVHIERKEAGWTIIEIEIDTVADVPGVDEATFRQHADKTKAGCPVSRALAAVPMTLLATLQK